MHCLSMKPCPLPEKAMDEACQEGGVTPRERSVHDRATSPPPLRGRPWARHGLVPRGALPILNCFGGRLPYSFVQISIEKRLSVKSSMYL
jgi:hypothetical protein